MNFRVDRWRAVALRSSLVVLTTVGALLLSSCGGSGQSSQSKRFHPTRMIVFGDESSLLLPPTTPHGIDALKYTNNGYQSGTSLIDCRVNLIWVQRLAARFGLVFDECNPDNLTPTAQMRATVNGKVADVVAAVDAFLASSAPVPKDLITVMVGTHDIIELYDSVKSSALTQDAAVAEIQRRGELLAAQINRLTNDSNSLGRLLYSTVPRVSLTPYGLSSSKSDADRTLLRLLTDEFNDSMRRQVHINGRSLGFLNTSQLFTNAVDSVNDNKDVDAIGNVKDPGCGAFSALACLPGNWVTADAYISYLWTDELHFSVAGHILIGDDAIDLATGLPW